MSDRRVDNGTCRETIRIAASAGVAAICFVMSVSALPARAGVSSCLAVRSELLPPDVQLSGLDLMTADKTITWRLLGLVPDFPLLNAVSDEFGALIARSAVRFHANRNDSPDRYGRVGIILSADKAEQSLQAALVTEGLARVHHEGLSEECRSRLVALEEGAIKARRGLWSDPRYNLLSAADPVAMEPRLNSYQVVEGRILSVGRTSRRAYLNFGQYWGEDFTVEIPRRAENSLVRSGMKPEDWAGRRVRVRGWLSESRGPMIVLHSPQQIDLIPD